MTSLEAMHAPGQQCAHMLPPAGFRDPFPSDVYRFNRVAPAYPADPCVLPNESDYICQADLLARPQNNPGMPTAGNDIKAPSDVFRFHKVHPPCWGNPCHPLSAGAKPICRNDTCPCTNSPRYPPSKPGRHFEYRYPAGATDCTMEAHKRGHVPADCARDISNHALVIQGRQVPGQPYNAGNGCWQHGYGNDTSSASSGMSVPATWAGHGSSQGTSMYNNFPSNMHFSCPYQQSCKCQGPPDPYDITGNITYGSCGYSTSKACNVARAPGNTATLAAPCPLCQNFYRPTPYICRPVYDRKYLLDCPEQDGPPADTYTFL